jgi:hypothetical protein
MVMNEENLGALLQSASKMDISKIDETLKTLAKYEGLLDRVSGIITKLDKIGVIPAVVRTLGKKGGIEDIDKPLNNPLNIIATTATHKLVYEKLNGLAENEVEQIYKQIILAEEAARIETERGNKQTDKPHGNKNK